jgi:DNA ligase-associated metallophosphoesterase
MEVSIRGHRFELLPERCLFWPAHRLLVVADLHLGKSETFQQNGFWLPSGSHRADLRRLDRVMRKKRVGRIVFLGDLVHTRIGVTPAVRRQFASWMERFGGEVHVILGNHDVGLAKRWPAEWVRASRHECLRLDSFLFQHQPVSEPIGGDVFYWAGHVHPMICLQKGPDRLRLPGFVISPSQGWLPAFSSISGGCDMTLAPHDRAFVVGDGNVYEV